MFLFGCSFSCNYQTLECKLSSKGYFRIGYLYGKFKVVRTENYSFLPLLIYIFWMTLIRVCISTNRNIFAESWSFFYIRTINRSKFSFSFNSKFFSSILIVAVSLNLFSFSIILIIFSVFVNKTILYRLRARKYWRRLDFINVVSHDLVLFSENILPCKKKRWSVSFK